MITALPTIGPGVSTGIGRRVVLAKVGLDGHDRGIKVVARGLRDAGFHVIYSGLWQSPAAVAQIVADEDAAWLGISLLNGAHLALVPRVVKALRDIGRVDVGLIVGGIIPPADIAQLECEGVRAFFGPGTTVAEIARALSAPQNEPFDLESLCEQSRQGNHVAIARLLTAAADAQHGRVVRTRFAKAEPEKNSLRRIAITGSPGVGKSSLIAGLIKSIRRGSTCRIAVLACDPQSPVTGGALLGDRLRMAEFIPSDNLFIRSLATPSGLQGVAQHMDIMGQIIAWSGFDVLLVETVGIGQGEIAVRSIADQVVLVLQPQTGDSVQWDKAGLWELADTIVVQKCDLAGADTMLVALREQMTRGDGSSLPVVGVSSHAQAGWDQLLSCLKLGKIPSKECGNP